MNFASYPQLNKIVTAQLAVFPQHDKYLEKRFRDITPDMLEFLDELALKILMITGEDLNDYCKDYQTLCEVLLKEEIEFRRTKRYRITTLKEADKLVYSNKEFMKMNMRGLLLSQLWWSNHSNIIHFFKTSFLPSFKSGFDLLEIGPGHGLFLSQAATHKYCKSATAWDISATSIKETKSALQLLGVSRDIDMQQRDMIIQPQGEFDMVILSEVLEHIEEPQKALESLFSCLKPDGSLFLNVPTNSPAPDHIYLFQHPDEIINMVENAGFSIKEKRLFPVANATLERAIKSNMTISTVLVLKP
jgi:2-polyprenyl-3-methyl-5-hydroxy-6-metoxy-1,4-benzoquinol methylase